MILKGYSHNGAKARKNMMVRSNSEDIQQIVSINPAIGVISKHKKLVANVLFNSS